jgi:hypothetical protein
VLRLTFGKRLGKVLGKDFSSNQHDISALQPQLGKGVLLSILSQKCLCQLPKNLSAIFKKP